jgi:hypothetical protein
MANIIKYKFYRYMKYLTLEECYKSATAIRLGVDNSYTEPSHIANVRDLCTYIYDPLCDHFGFKIPFNSLYRSERLNKVIKGAKNSQHLTGQAIDLDPNCQNGLCNQELFDYIRANIKFDQLIYEFEDPNGGPAWVHVSYSNSPRGSVLKAIKVGSRTKYIPL